MVGVGESNITESSTHAHTLQCIQTLTLTHHGLEWEGHAVGVGESDIGKSVRNSRLHLLASLPELELRACVGEWEGGCTCVGVYVWVGVCGCTCVGVGVV